MIRSASCDDVAAERRPFNPLNKLNAVSSHRHTLPAGFDALADKRYSVQEFYIDAVAGVPHKLQNTGATNAQTFMLVFKSFLGTGVLVLPKAFVNGGLVFSIFVMVAVGIMNVVVLVRLSDTKDVVGEGMLPDIGRKAGGKLMEAWVSFSIVFIQVSCGCMYLIFMGETLNTVVEQIANCAQWSLDLGSWLYILILAVVVAPLCWIRNMKSLAHPALFADILIVGGLIYLAAYATYKIESNGSQSFDIINSSSDLALSLGTVLFSFEGVCLVLPIKGAMADPLAYPKVLSGVMALLAFIYAGFASINYLAHGKELSSIILLDLPQNSPAVLVTQVAYVIAIAVTFPLQVYPALQVLESFIWKPKPPLAEEALPAQRLLMENVFRSVVCLVSAGIAIGSAKNFDNFTALGGGLCSMPLLFIFPPLFHYILVPHLSTFQKVTDILIVAMGVLLSVGVTALTIYDWITGGEDDPSPECVPS